jgi:hypothetical protein
VIRLLWKEWHELKWYLAALALGPWLATLLLSSKLGYYRGEGIYSGDLMILLLVLAFWAGTRMPGETRPTRFGVGWLPIKRWKVWLVKFGPGFLVAVLFPLWVHVVALYRVHPIRYEEHETALMHVAANLACSISIYTCTFAVSMFASSVVAIMCGYALTFMAPGVLLVYAGIPLDMYQTLFSGIALAVGLALWTKGRGAGAVRRAGMALVAAIPGMALGVLVLAVAAVINAGSIQAFRANLKTVVLWRLTHILSRSPSYDIWNIGQMLPSPDGRFLAYVHWLRDGRNYRRREIRVRNSQGDIAVLRRSLASPTAWLPDGRLVVAAHGNDWETALLEWDPGTGKVERLASMPRITAVIPDPLGDRIAILAAARRSSGTDLWVLDLRSRRLKLLRPGLSLGEWWQDDAVRWDGERLVFYRDFRRGYWSVRADGTDFRQVFPLPKEGHGD